MPDEGLPGAPQVDVIVPTSDSIAGNIADDALIPVILGPTQVGTQRFDELRNQVIQGLVTAGQLAAHTGDQDAHYTPADIVTAIDQPAGLDGLARRAAAGADCSWSRTTARWTATAPPATRWASSRTTSTGSASRSPAR